MAPSSDSDTPAVGPESWSIDLVGEWLRENNLDILHQRFQDNYVDGEALLLLNESTIKGLIPEIGLKIKFLSAFKKVTAKSEKRPTQVSTLPTASSNAVMTGTPKWQDKQLGWLPRTSHKAGQYFNSLLPKFYAAA